MYDYLVGVVLGKQSSTSDGEYKFVYNGTSISSDCNVLYVMVNDELKEEDLRKRLKGTEGIEKIIKL